MSVKFELKGIVKSVAKIEGTSVSVAEFKIEVEGTKKKEVYSLICFNKLAEYLLSVKPVKHEAEVKGTLQHDKYGVLKMAAYKFDDLTHKAKGNDPFDSIREESKSQVIEMLDKKTSVVIKSFDNIKEAAVYAKVKKSRIEYAIKNGKEAGGYWWSRSIAK